MKFVKELVTAGTHIPAAALYLSGLGDSERLELHTLSMELVTHLAQICGPCTGCENGCPVELLEGSEIPLPEPREEGNGIPPVALLDIITSFGICLSGLREHLSSGDIVYGI